MSLPVLALPDPNNALNSAQTLARLSVLSLASPASRRNYAREIAAWLDAGGVLTRESVQAHLVRMRERGVGVSGRNVALAAIKLFAREAWERKQLSDAELAALERIRAERIRGQHAGNWLSVEQAQKLIDQARAGANGVRNAALLACMIGCGLRRAEVCRLEWKQWQQRDGRWCFLDVTGKGGRVRTIAAPEWVAREVERWKLEQEEKTK